VASTTSQPPRREPPTDIAPRSRNIISGVLLGIGIAGFIDETVFHQLLHWHHFYDKSTPTVGLVSDGIFHAVSWFAAIAALFILADIRRRGGFLRDQWVGAILLGAGGFQLYDGTIQHKLMKLHQIRYHVDVAPYDVVWNILAAIMIAVGIILVRRHRTTAERAG
jgi:uncharacterized membrane protein